MNKKSVKLKIKSKYVPDLAVKMALCAAQVPSSSLNKMSLKTPSTRQRSSKLEIVLVRINGLGSSLSCVVAFKRLKRSGISKNSAACKQNYEKNTSWSFCVKVCNCCLFWNKYVFKAHLILHMSGIKVHTCLASLMLHNFVSNFPP